jgi:hypothetical protein
MLLEFNERWVGRRSNVVISLMKRLAFDIISSLLFSFECGTIRNALACDFPQRPFLPHSDLGAREGDEEERV